MMSKSPAITNPVTPINELTISHQEFWNEVNIPVSSSTHLLRRLVAFLEVSVELERRETIADLKMYFNSTLSNKYVYHIFNQRFLCFTAQPVLYVRRYYSYLALTITYIIQRTKRSTLSTVVLVPVHVQHLLSTHREQPTQNAFLKHNMYIHMCID